MILLNSKDKTKEQELNPKNYGVQLPSVSFRVIVTVFLLIAHGY